MISRRDAAGNLIFDPLAPNMAAAGGVSDAVAVLGQYYEYDEENRVVQVRRYDNVGEPNNALVLAAYVYDALGRSGGTIQVSVCSGGRLALLGATDVINTRALDWSAPVFRSGGFLVVYFGVYVVFLLLYKGRLSRKEPGGEGAGKNGSEGR